MDDLVPDDDWKSEEIEPADEEFYDENENLTPEQV